jgi:hypothetical protein
MPLHLAALFDPKLRRLEVEHVGVNERIGDSVTLKVIRLGDGSGTRHASCILRRRVGCDEARADRHRQHNRDEPYDPADSNFSGTLCHRFPPSVIL